MRIDVRQPAKEVRILPSDRKLILMGDGGTLILVSRLIYYDQERNYECQMTNLGGKFQNSREIPVSGELVMDLPWKRASQSLLILETSVGEFRIWVKPTDLRKEEWSKQWR